MAISVKRFIAWFAVAAVAIWAGWVGAMASNRFRYGEYWNPGRSSAEQKARRLTTALGVLERRDSIARALQARPPANGLSVVIANTATARERVVLDSAIRAFWRRAAGDAATQPAVVVITDYRQQADAGGRNEMSFVLTPRQTDGRSCVIVMSTAGFGQLGMGQQSQFSVSAVTALLENTAGICALHAKYGPPGAAIARWLASAGWAPAASSESDADSATAIVFRTPTDGQRPRTQSRTTAGLASGGGISAGSRSWSIRFPHIACLAGRADACEAVPSLREGPFYGIRSSMLPADVVPSPIGSTRMKPWNRQLLAALEEQLGPAKFATFWTSTKPPAEAMVDASGRTIGAWINDRLRQAHQPLVASPWPTALEWLVQLALIGIPVGTMVLTRRRRFLNP